MTNPIKIKVDETGEWGQAINPYSNDFDGGLLYYSFNKANPKRHLTSKQTPNSEIECREVWQGQDRGDMFWHTIFDNVADGLKEYKSFQKFSDYMHMNRDIATRIALEPLTAPVDGGEKAGKFSSIKDLKPLEEKIWNAALDEAVRVLESDKKSIESALLAAKLNPVKSKYAYALKVVENQINQLNQLRK